MIPSIKSPVFRIPIEPLNQTSFAPFGTVIQNPDHAPPSTTPPLSVTANQGSATKYLDVTKLSNFYHLAPSKNPASPVVNMFVCAPRPLRPHQVPHGMEPAFDVRLLERHPYTPQIFIPVGLARNDPSTCYLVVVAPTLPAAPPRPEVLTRSKPYPTPDPEPKKQSPFERARPEPFTNSTAPPPATRPLPPEMPKGPGMPDVRRLRAFVANGSQGVTYGAGTWHAPMVVIGAEKVAFVVLQYANAVGNEDCQEVEIVPGKEGEWPYVVLSGIGRDTLVKAKM
ncbi:ureidoglycolate hydrolase [Trichodelitschia bisporula]|uniref:Ureidoglycolate hydrolase n=1 Tax=Trichodelitschia bisporula TaxID=703511 RepID=A0A6G1HV06_9PEZI|nr:ureidoglycolate hydrolase [Trichodelitschia bisporula]